ncbi:conjugative transposon protein TraN [Ginsengibacter hankyongi]|uniref:Conjugative transposon protein TraN n=1 Tax=Ginsengibacter hankyongi TaxID=2607284 RepID=A0A5J5IH09_9BACT|nr:conjugative transposon protein TraN [Ginsengibacter hankyongi]KAA9038691.1 conjugative transposon protein TraN [Ginsengibacter hankyongi]
MKQFVSLLCGLGLLITSFAQSPALSITTDKTISLIFPFPIIHVDRGTKDVLVEQVKEAGNILLVKAASANFSATNLSVITNDGSVYSFPVSYEKTPSTWIYSLPSQNSATPERYADGILGNPPTMHGIRYSKWDMLAKVIGIYIHENTIYFQLQLVNQSSIDYDIDLLRFYIRDKKKAKRAAMQENEIKPLYIAGNTKLVKANSTSTLVVALEKFTIPDAKFLSIEVMEKNGGRHLLLKIHNNKIIRAVSLPDLK